MQNFPKRTGDVKDCVVFPLGPPCMMAWNFLNPQRIPKLQKTYKWHPFSMWQQGENPDYIKIL